MPGARNRLTGASATPETGATSPLHPDHVDPKEDVKIWDLAGDLAAILEAQFPNPAESLLLVTDVANRIIAENEASTGGAMGKQHTAPNMGSRPRGPSKPVRGHNGFERESATYRRLKPELLAKNEGKFVVVVGEEMIGPFDSFKDARWEGFQKFGLGPLYVKQVLAEDPVIHTSRGF